MSGMLATRHRTPIPLQNGDTDPGSRPDESLPSLTRGRVGAALVILGDFFELNGCAKLRPFAIRQASQRFCDVSAVWWGLPRNEWNLVVSQTSDCGLCIRIGRALQKIWSFLPQRFGTRRVRADHYFTAGHVGCESKYNNFTFTRGTETPHASPWVLNRVADGICWPSAKLPHLQLGSLSRKPPRRFPRIPETKVPTTLSSSYIPPVALICAISRRQPGRTRACPQIWPGEPSSHRSRRTTLSGEILTGTQHPTGPSGPLRTSSPHTRSGVRG